MKIIAFAASTSSKSINKQLIRYAANRIESGLIPDAQVSVVELESFEMPIYSSDRQEAGGVPQQAQQFFDAIAAADAVVISFAEHNGHVTAAYKNTFDWASRIDRKVFGDKPGVLLATAPGPGGGANVLAASIASAPHFGLDVRASLSIPRFGDNFDTEAGVLTNPELDTKLTEALSKLVD